MTSSIASLFESIQPRYPEFKDQIALVTGSSRGIGKGIALRLAREGMKVVIHGIDQQEVDATAQEFQSLGAKVISVRVDLAQTDAVEQLFRQTLDHFGTVNLLVNNAADLRRTNVEKADTAMLDHQLMVNLRAPYLASLKAADIMRQNKRGSIVNISSVGGLRAHWSGLPYDVTKGAIDVLTRTMAIELGRDGIRVNAVAPGATQTERIRVDNVWAEAVARRVPLERFGTVLEIGAVVAFLASSDASYITGQVLYVDGGITTQLSPREYPI